MAGKMIRGHKAIKFLLDKGLLFEINRYVLHPLGLALAVKTDDEAFKFDGIWDRRDLEEGLRFDDEALKEGHEKHTKYMEKEGFVRLAKRYEQLGYIYQEQPREEVIVKDSQEYKEKLFGEEPTK